MSPTGFEPAIPASGRLQTLALDRSAPGTCNFDTQTVQPVASRYTGWAIAADTATNTTIKSTNYIRPNTTKFYMFLYNYVFRPNFRSASGSQSFLSVQEKNTMKVSKQIG